MNDWLERGLVCPRDHGPLCRRQNLLICDAGHEYPVVQDIPIMLLGDAEQTLWVAASSLERAKTAAATSTGMDDYYIDTLGISDDERHHLERELSECGNVDPVVRYMVGATNGCLYKPLVGKLESVPIPDLRLPSGGGTLLDIGCNWGRWCVAAARKGYDVVGIDPSLGAILAARRISQRLGVSARFVVADARFLPFAPGRFDVVFSYSVLQHLSIKDATAALREIGRVLREGAFSLIQMPNALGIRSLWHLLRRRFRTPRGFEVRYWTPTQLSKTFSAEIGPTRLSVDAYFGLGIQKTDAHLLPMKYRWIVHSSEVLRSLSKTMRPLVYVADSLYAESVKRAATGVAVPKPAGHPV
jgi:SAM-dependent methyltransferase/uncharacterized protein YbaR (Trm112 family)